MKKVIFVLLLMIVVLVSVMATPAAINPSNLPHDESFNDGCGDFLRAYESIKFPALENNKVSSSVIRKVKRFYKTLNKIKNPNYDESLLKLLVMRCLYNFDEVSSTEIDSFFDEIDKKNPEKAEHHWIYGNYLSTTLQTAKGLKEHEKYMELRNLSISNFFLDDYAYSNFICGKSLSAYYAITNGGTIEEERIKNQNLLKIIKNSIKDSSSSEKYTGNQVWKFTLSKDDNYLFSTMLGISIPYEEEWKMQMKEFDSKSPALVMIKPERVKYENEEIGFSIIMMAFPTKLFGDDIENGYSSKLPVINHETKMINKTEFSIYTYEDKSKYQDLRNGSRGYLYCATITPNKNSGVKCEHAIDLQSLKDNSQKDSEAQDKYYQSKDAYKRLDEPVTIIICVDSCNAIAKETLEFMDDFLSKSVFE